MQNDLTVNRSRKIRWISEDKLDDIGYPEEELHRAVCIRNTVDLLVEIEERARRWNRCRQKIHALSKRQDVMSKKVDDVAEQDKVAVKNEVDNNKNNNNIYLKSNIHKSSIDYKYIHMYNKIMLYT